MKNVKGNFLFGLFFIVVYAGILLMLNFLFFPHMLSCKDKGTAEVISVYEYYAKDSDGDMQLYYRPTYEIDGKVYEKSVGTNEKIHEGDIRNVIYNTQYSVCYTTGDRLIYWVLTVVFSIFLFVGLSLMKSVLFNILQAIVLLWLEYKQDNKGNKNNVIQLNKKE